MNRINNMAEMWHYIGKCGKSMAECVKNMVKCGKNQASGTRGLLYRYFYLNEKKKIKKDRKSCYNATIGTFVNKFNDLRVLQSCYNVAIVANVFSQRARANCIFQMCI